MGCDGLSSLTNFNVSTVKKMSVLSGVKIWEAVYVIATNVSNAVVIDNYDHLNKSIQRDISTILKKKFKITWAWKDDQLKQSSIKQC